MITISFLSHYYRNAKYLNLYPLPLPLGFLFNPIKASVFDFKWSTCCAGCNANPICV